MQKSTQPLPIKNSKRNLPASSPKHKSPTEGFKLDTAMEELREKRPNTRRIK